MSAARPLAVLLAVAPFAGGGRTELGAALHQLAAEVLELPDARGECVELGLRPPAAPTIASSVTRSPMRSLSWRKAAAEGLAAAASGAMKMPRDSITAA